MLKAFKDRGRKQPNPNYIVNKVTKRALYTKNNIHFPNGIIMGEDACVSFPLVFYAEKIAVVNKPLYIVNRHNTSSVTQSKVVSRFNDDVKFATALVTSLYSADKSIPKSLVNSYARSWMTAQKLLILTTESAPALFRATYPELNSLCYARYVQPFANKVWFVLCVLRLERVALWLRRVKRALRGQRQLSHPRNARVPAAKARRTVRARRYPSSLIFR